MMCDKCGKNLANVHVSQNVNGVKVEQHLCTECAGAMNNMFSNFFNMFGGMREMSLAGMPAGAQQGGAMDFEALGLTFPNLERTESPEMEPERAVDRLQAQLDAAVQAQEFEKAAELRDQIFFIEKEQMQEGSD